MVMDCPNDCEELALAKERIKELEARLKVAPRYLPINRIEKLLLRSRNSKGEGVVVASEGVYLLSNTVMVVRDHLEIEFMEGLAASITVKEG